MPHDATKPYQLPNRAPAQYKLQAYSYADPETGCRLWLRSKDREGYGRLTIDGTAWRTHRLSYIEYIGPILGDLFVCHHCDTPACIEPKHLFLGTHQDNMIDMIRKGRRPDNDSFSFAKLSDDQVREIVEKLRLTSEYQYCIAALYSVDHRTISSINMGGSWAHLTGASRSNPIRRTL